MRYRRAIIPGATYFFTVNLKNRKSNLLIAYIDILRSAFRNGILLPQWAGVTQPHLMEFGEMSGEAPDLRLLFYPISALYQSLD